MNYCNEGTHFDDDDQLTNMVCNSLHVVPIESQSSFPCFEGQDFIQSMRHKSYKMFFLQMHTHGFITINKLCKIYLSGCVLWLHLVHFILIYFVNVHPISPPLTMQYIKFEKCKIGLSLSSLFSKQMKYTMKRKIVQSQMHHNTSLAERDSRVARILQ